MTKQNKWKVAKGKNGSAALRLGNTLLMPTWNTQDGAVMDSTDIVQRIAAALNYTDGIPLDQIKAINRHWEDQPLRRALANLIEQEDYNNDVQYVGDIYPDWFLDLAGGLNNLNVSHKSDFDEDDEDEEGENQRTNLLWKSPGGLHIGSRVKVREDYSAYDAYNGTPVPTGEVFIVTNVQPDQPAIDIENLDGDFWHDVEIMTIEVVMPEAQSS